MRSLSIKNYRSIKELDIDFPESGLIGIVGHNGAGKSSLLESIGWALYGTQAIRGKADGLTTIGAKGKCKVVMEFDHGEDGPYIVERRLKDAKLKAGGKEIAVMTSGVNSKIEKLLNMDYRAFYTSIFTKQGGLSSFTDMTASQRQETVERLLEVSKVKNARINIGTEARALENQLHGKRVAIEKEDQILEEIKEQEQIINQLKEKETELKDKKITSEKKKLKTDKELENIRIKQKIFQDTDRKLINIENDLKVSNSELQNLERNISEIVRKKKYAEKREIELKHIKSDEFYKELDEKNIAIDQINNKIKKKTEELNTLKIKYGKEDARIEDKHKHIIQIEKLENDSECPVCLRPLGEHGPKAINELKEEIEHIKLRIDPEKIKKIKDRIDNYNQKKEQLEEDIKKLNDKDLEIKSVEAELKSLNVENLEEDEKIFNKNLEEILDRIQNQEKKLKETKMELDKIGFNETEYKNLSEEQDRAVMEWSKSIENLERHRTNIATASQKLKDKDEQIQDIEKLKSEIKDEERTLTLLRTLEERLKGFRTFLTGRIAPVLQNRTGERLSQITQARYNSVHVDRNDYSIQVMDGTQLYPLERFSGGEVDAFNLAFRLSISDVITERLGSELGMVVLDEVLGSQDFQRQTSILKGLENLAKNIGQVMMVTHIEGIKDQLQHVWSVNLDVEKGTQITIL